jgi:hypothetical protein
VCEHYDVLHITRFLKTERKKTKCDQEEISTDDENAATTDVEDDEDDVDEDDIHVEISDPAERFPICRFKYNPYRHRRGPLSRKMFHGYYFEHCPCSQLFHHTIFNSVGCVCRLLFHGVRGKTNSHLRFFKGSRSFSLNWVCSRVHNWD